MLQIVINNLENGKIESEDLEYILQLDDIESITFLYEKSQDTQRKLNEKIKRKHLTKQRISITIKTTKQQREKAGGQSNGKVNGL